MSYCNSIYSVSQSSDILSTRNSLSPLAIGALVVNEMFYFCTQHTLDVNLPIPRTVPHRLLVGSLHNKSGQWCAFIGSCKMCKTILSLGQASACFFSVPVAAAFTWRTSFSEFGVDPHFAHRWLHRPFYPLISHSSAPRLSAAVL